MYFVKNKSKKKRTGKKFQRKKKLSRSRKINKNMSVAKDGFSKIFTSCADNTRSILVTSGDLLFRSKIKQNGKNLIKR